MQIKLSFIQEPLLLPKRFEILEREVEKKGGEITKIVRKIESADRHVQNLLGRIHVGGVGQFQLFLGKSGSGKTTFLRTLPQFFENVFIHSFSLSESLSDIITRISEFGSDPRQKIFVIDERDNPEIDYEELRSFFEALRVLFRRNEGKVLVVWPITDEKAADIIAEIAWQVGRDSISPLPGPIYKFEGLSKNHYFEVADVTIRSLNNGESLESFGIVNDTTSSLYLESETIGDFYSRIEAVVYNNNEQKWKVLEQKVKPKIWILLPGDNINEVDRTVRSLTQGVENKIDVDRMCAYLDDVSNRSGYLNDWRESRSQAGFLFRFLDVRLFAISPNLALATSRVYGPQSVTGNLKKSSESKSICLSTLKRSELYLALTDNSSSSKRAQSGTKPDTQHEYLRLQQKARTGDKELNKAFAAAIKELLEQDGYDEFSIKAEKQELHGTNLKPDILIELPDNQVVCLELTWRSTGQKVEGEIDSKQNTLTPGHIQKYILEKVMEYVKALGL